MDVAEACRVWPVIKGTGSPCPPPAANRILLSSSILDHEEQELLTIRYWEPLLLGAYIWSVIPDIGWGQWNGGLVCPLARITHFPLLPFLVFRPIICALRLEIISFHFGGAPFIIAGGEGLGHSHLDSSTPIGVLHAFIPALNCAFLSCDGLIAVMFYFMAGCWILLDIMSARWVPVALYT